MRQHSPLIPSTARRAFTLTEMLVVVGIITILVAIAVPSFKAMSGGGSVDAAANNLSAALSRARAEAIGSGRMAGLLFYIDPGTDRVGALLIRERVSVGLVPARVQEIPLFEQTPEADYVLLPTGVGLQMLNNWQPKTGNPSLRNSDGYVGFNVISKYTSSGANVSPSIDRTLCGGAILFDGAGRLVAEQSFALALKDDAGKTSQIAKTLTADPDITFAPNVYCGVPARPVSRAHSSVGVALFDAADYRAQPWAAGTPLDDVKLWADPKAAPPTAYNAVEEAEEKWLDEHSTPYLVNRYNGTLVKSE